jgi:hypothetical protein
MSRDIRGFISDMCLSWILIWFMIFFVSEIVDFPSDTELGLISSAPPLIFARICITSFLPCLLFILWNSQIIFRAILSQKPHVL